MAGSDKDNDGFLSRWAERKRAVRQSESGSDAVAEGADAPPTDDQSGDAVAPVAEEAFDPKDLPDIETLEKDADFSVFMHEKVPEALRRRALRRLWKVDPLFGFRDGMNDYDEDYTDAALVVEGLKTVYRVGKGMWTAEDEEAEAAALAGAQATDESAATGQEGEGAAPERPEPENADSEDMAAGPEEGSTADESSLHTPAAPAVEIASAKAESVPSGSPSVVSDPVPAPIRRSSGGAMRRRWGDPSG